jgi:hypothetical protein
MWMPIQRTMRMWMPMVAQRYKRGWWGNYVAMYTLTGFGTVRYNTVPCGADCADCVDIADFADIADGYRLCGPNMLLRGIFILLYYVFSFLVEILGFLVLGWISLHVSIRVFDIRLGASIPGLGRFDVDSTNHLVGFFAVAPTVAPCVARPDRRYAKLRIAYDKLLVRCSELEEQVASQAVRIQSLLDDIASGVTKYAEVDLNPRTMHVSGTLPDFVAEMWKKNNAKMACGS